LGGLWEAAGRGAKPKCKIEDMQYVAELLAKETRTYNSSQLVKKLKQERGVDLSSDRLRRLLKKTISIQSQPYSSPYSYNKVAQLTPSLVRINLGSIAKKGVFYSTSFSSYSSGEPLCCQQLAFKQEIVKIQ
jgi:hypothetical protein